MSIISTGNLPKALVPGVADWAGLGYREHENFNMYLFEKRTTNRAFEEHTYVVGLGLATKKNQGAPLDMDDMSQHFVAQYRVDTYGLAIRVTMEAVEDNLYKDKIMYGGKLLGRSYRETEQIVGHNVLNNAFNSAFVYGDGVSLVNSAHPFKSGGTWSNQLSAPTNLSQAAIQDLLIQISDLEDDKGLKINVKPVSLHVPTSYQFLANEIVNSTLRSDTANNAVNVVNGIFPMGVKVHTRFTSSTAWFIKTDVDTGLVCYEKKAPEIDGDNEFYTKDLLFSIVGRYAYGVTDPRAIFGTAGV